tara:strand:- start:1254 stop:1970 length:717 start_codon:yes stop_codon:yes gene_type:complete
MALQVFNSNAPIQYEGCVISLRESNGYHDSDFYAKVWDKEIQDVISVEYHTTRGASTGWAKVDCTNEMLEQYMAEAEANPNTIKIARDKWKKAMHDANVSFSENLDRLLVQKGDIVYVDIKRGKYKGTKGQGEVFFLRQDQFATKRLSNKLDGSYSVGLKIDGKAVFTNEKNCKKVINGEVQENQINFNRIELKDNTTNSYEYRIVKENYKVHRGQMSDIHIKSIGTITDKYLKINQR